LIFLRKKRAKDFGRSFFRTKNGQKRLKNKHKKQRIMIKKQMYEAPEIEVLELRMEGVIATSVDPFDDGFNSNQGEETITW